MAEVHSRDASLALFQQSLEQALGDNSSGIGPTGPDGSPVPGVVLDGWVLFSAWVDESGDWSYVRLNSKGLPPHVRHGLTEIDYDEEG